MGRLVPYTWLSGFCGGCFLGALIACPAKTLSLPVTAVLTLAFLYLAIRESRPRKRGG